MKGERKAKAPETQQEPQGDEAKRARGKLLTLAPLTPEEALREAMKAGPMPPGWKPDQE